MSSPDREVVVYRYLKSLHATTFGQSFDVINNTDEAVRWLTEVWDDLETADREFTASLNGNSNGHAPSETILTFCEDCRHYTANIAAHKTLQNRHGSPSMGNVCKSVCEIMQQRDQEDTLAE